MSLKLKCHWNWNVSLTEMSQKLKWHWKLNGTEYQLVAIWMESAMYIVDQLWMLRHHGKYQQVTLKEAPVGDPRVGESFTLLQHPYHLPLDFYSKQLKHRNTWCRLGHSKWYPVPGHSKGYPRGRQGQQFEWCSEWGMFRIERGRRLLLIRE